MGGHAIVVMSYSQDKYLISVLKAQSANGAYATSIDRLTVSGSDDMDVKNDKGTLTLSATDKGYRAWTVLV